MVHTYYKTFYTSIPSLEIKLLSIVILHTHVALHQEISTFTTTEIFLRISNLQHVSPKLYHSLLDSHNVKT